MYTVKRLTALFLIAAAASAVAQGGTAHQTAQPWPIQLGTSGGNIYDRSTLYCCSGTLGALVQDAAGNPYILSNNHVLARFNQADLGEPVNHPGQIDQNCGQHGIVAYLANYIPILSGKGRSLPLNQVDAAIAIPADGAVRADGSILQIGTVSANTVAASVGQTVQKSGRTTGHTTGSVSAIDVVVDIGYSDSCGGPAKYTARFINQIRITPGSFSAGGDSGSLIVESGSVDPIDSRPRAAGLLFAGSSSSTIANPIDTVLSLLGVSMVGGGLTEPPATGSVAGTVTEASNNQPIAGATVTVDTGQSAQTDSAGAYSISGVPAGSRSVSVSATGYAGASQNVTVEQDAVSVADFALNPVVTATQTIVECVTYRTDGGPNSDKHLNIVVRVLDDMGAPAAGAEVTVAVTRNGNPVGTGAATANSSGDAGFSIKNAANGVYSTQVTNVVSGSLAFEGSTPANSFNKGADASPASFCRTAAAQDTASTTRADAIARARTINARHSNALFGHAGVVGHGVGLSGGEPVIEVYLENETAASRARIPSDIEGVPVRIVVTGAFEAF